MYSSCGHFIYEFVFICLFIHFIVYCAYSKFVYDFMFLMYRVMDHIHWICYAFEHSSSIWSVTGRIIDLCYIILFDVFIYWFYFIVFFFFPADNRIDLFVHILDKWRYRWKKRIGIWAGCAYIDRHRDKGVYEIGRNRKKKQKDGDTHRTEHKLFIWRWW